MTAASVAALTVYDMVKGVERGVEIRGVRLVSKTGGKSGDVASAADPTGGDAAGPAAAPGARVGRAGSAKRKRPRPAGVTDGADADRTALVLTASDGAAAGRPRRRVRRARRPSGSRRLGFDGRARASSPDERADDRAALRRRRGGPPPRSSRPAAPGLTPRDVTPQATRAVHRLRGPGPGRGDARRRPGRRRRSRTCRAGVVGVRGRIADRQPAGQPEGRRSSRSRRSCRCSTTPSRRSPGRTTTARRAAAARRRPTGPRTPTDVRAVRRRPGLPARLPVFWGAAAFFALAMARHLRVFAAAPRAAAPVRPTSRRAARRASSSTRSSRRRCSRTRGPG